PLSEELVDEHEGLEDLKAGLIRTIGRPEDRFFEDGLRPIRACRFLSTLDFFFFVATEKALSNPDVQKRTALVAIERFTDELRKGMKAANPGPMLRKLQESGLLQVFLGRLDHPEKTEIPGHGVLPLPFETELLAAPAGLSDIGTALRQIQDGWDWLVDIRMYLWFRFLFPDLNLQQKNAILRGWKFPNHTLQCLEACYLLFESNPALMSLDSEAKQAVAIVQGNYESRKLLFRLDKILSGRLQPFLQIWETLLELLPEPDGLSKNLIQILGHDFRHGSFRTRDLAIGGKDLMAMGIQGKAVGDALQECLEQVWAHPERNERNTLLEFLKKQRHN
ncbi:MAG: hypothetical protein KDK25_10785, partial [Leptospiraceae bacterium]|nr:hypothetical protein [Leptospiraceae bacterium]